MAATAPDRLPISRSVLGIRIDATSYADATEQIMSWAQEPSSRYVCVANTHVAVEARSDAAFRRGINSADLITPDGMPLVWALKLMDVAHATRVYGPDLTLHVCRAAAAAGVPIGLYGGTPERIADFAAMLEQTCAGIQVVCRIAPPFRPLTPEEDEAHTRMIIASGARILLVGIGCPKQERWMAEHAGRIPAVMIGVGAAFDFHSGHVRQAPSWMQNAGLEWLFRLMVEPRRLLRRYARVVPLFLVYFALEYGRWRFSKERFHPVEARNVMRHS